MESASYLILVLSICGLVFVFAAKLLFGFGRLVARRRREPPPAWWLGTWQGIGEAERRLIFYAGFFLDVDSLGGRRCDYQLSETEDGAFWLEFDGVVRRLERTPAGIRIAGMPDGREGWADYRKTQELAER